MCIPSPLFTFRTCTWEAGRIWGPEGEREYSNSLESGKGGVGAAKVGMAKEIQGFVSDKRCKGKGSEMDVEGEEEVSTGGEVDWVQEKRDSFERGVFIEVEYAFVRAVGNFCKGSVWAGSFKGNYYLNVKKQMEMRDFVERKGDKKER
jgi:hypothetical protein